MTKKEPNKKQKTRTNKENKRKLEERERERDKIKNQQVGGQKRLRTNKGRYSKINKNALV